MFLRRNKNRPRWVKSCPSRKYRAIQWMDLMRNIWFHAEILDVWLQTLVSWLIWTHFLRNKISVWALFDHHFVSKSSKKTAKCPWDGWPRNGRGCSFSWVSNIWAPCPREGQGLTTLRMPVPPQFQHFHQKSSFLCLWDTHVRTWRSVKVCFLSVGSDAFLCHRPRGCGYFAFSCFLCRFTMGFEEPGKSCFCLYFGRPCSLGWALFFTPAASPWLLGISVVLKWAWHHGTHWVIVSSVCHCLFSPWTVLAFLWIRVTLEQVSRHVVTTGIFGWWIMPRIWVALPSGIRWWACKCCPWSKQICLITVLALQKGCWQILVVSLV